MKGCDSMPHVSTVSKNPFRPGAGHMPPYLAGREIEEKEFVKRLKQEVILENIVITGLRGVGKTVLLEALKPLAINKGWRWVGTDLSESSSLTEERLATRILTDLSVITSSIVLEVKEHQKIGFGATVETEIYTLNFSILNHLYTSTPGLIVDKLKYVLEFVWSYMQRESWRGLIFAYDEAQNLDDHSTKDEYPLSLLLEVFQSLQRKNIPFMLVLVGLPTLFPKLVESRTYSERMFRVLFLQALDTTSSKEAIRKPLENSTFKFSDSSIDSIVEHSGGYPYFIQFICREAFDLYLQRANGQGSFSIPMDEITRKLDSDFFSGRWAKTTDRQRELLKLISSMDNCNEEFTVQEIVEASRTSNKPFSSSHVHQMLSSLSEAGLIYKNRHGKYSFAVPLMGNFIKRQG
jgi:type II secretory pathway predicted ATPase ExeA